MTPEDPRRLGVFWIGERDLMALLSSAKGTTFTVQHDLPDGFKVESVHYDMVTRSWAVMVAHESLPAVDDGSKCAWVDHLQLQIHPAPDAHLERSRDDETQPDVTVEDQS